MKTIIHITQILVVILTTNYCSSQKLALLDGKVLLGETAIFSYDQKVPNNEFHLFRLNSEKTIVDIKQFHHELASNSNTEYKTLTFPKQNVIIKSTTLSTRNWKYIIQLLLDEKVIAINGNVNVPNLEEFTEKYGEKINFSK